ncbi:transglutaminase family protein, partial [Rhizobium ruizarguesonis]
LIASSLAIKPDMVQPAYEDPADWIIKEGNLPENVDPANSKLPDPEERNRIARVGARGLTGATGDILPVQAWNAKAAESRVWVSEKWRNRRGKS